MKEARECIAELRQIRRKDDSTKEKNWSEAESIIEKHMTRREARLVEALEEWSKCQEAYIKGVENPDITESDLAISLDEFDIAEKQLQKALAEHSKPQEERG